MSEINDDKKKQIIEADALSVEDALEIADGEGGAKKKRSRQFTADAGTKEAPKQFRIVPEDDTPAHVVKSSYYDAPEQIQSKSSSELYADITESILKEAALAKEQEKKQKRELKEKLKNDKKHGKQKSLNEPQTQANGDYALEGEVNAIIANNEMYLRRMQHNKRKRRILAVVIISFLVLFLLTFGISTIVSNITGFTVNLNGADSQKGLTLYDNAALQNGTSRLVTTSIPECDNITYSELIHLVMNTLDKNDGQQTKDFMFFAYSFYVQNVGRGTVDFRFRVNMLGFSKGVDDAVRVMVVDDTTYYGAPDNRRRATVYAKPKCDAAGNWLYDADNRPIMQKLYDPLGQLYPDNKQDNAQPFAGKTVAVDTEVKNFGYKAGKNLRKYTVVIYLEGGDEDCVSAIKGGGIKFNVDMLVTDYRLDIDS